MTAKSSIKQAVLTARIIRADGTVEDLGELGFYHRSRYKRLLHKVKKLWRQYSRMQEWISLAIESKARARNRST